MIDVPYVLIHTSCSLFHDSVIWDCLSVTSHNAWSPQRNLCSLLCPQSATLCSWGSGGQAPVPPCSSSTLPLEWVLSLPLCWPSPSSAPFPRTPLTNLTCSQTNVSTSLDGINTSCMPVLAVGESCADRPDGNHSNHTFSASNCTCCSRGCLVAICLCLLARRFNLRAASNRIHIPQRALRVWPLLPEARFLARPGPWSALQGPPFGGEAPPPL